MNDFANSAEATSDGFEAKGTGNRATNPVRRAD